jgi:hypothetical protein
MIFSRLAITGKKKYHPARKRMCCAAVDAVAAGLGLDPLNLFFVDSLFLR